MDHFAKLIAALVLAFAGTAHAGYAQAVPPSGWSPGSYAASANDASYGRVIYAPNGPTTTVGGQAIKMPAAYRLAANAPRIAAAVIFANPYLRAGVGIASWLGISSIVWDAAKQQWIKTIQSETDGYVYYIPGYQTEYSTAQSACNSYVNSYNTSAVPVYSNQPYATSCELTTYFGAKSQSPLASQLRTTPATENKPLTKEEFEKELSPDISTPGAPWTMPQTVPFELPHPTPLPIEHQPFINPLPGPDPQHSPRFVPSGDPVPNPNYDPNAAPGPNNQPYTQPGTRIVPSPTPSQPWRVDHQPVNRPQADGMPKPNPDAEPGTDPTDKPKPEEQQSLCEKHPDIVACAKLGEPGQATPVPNETKTLTIDPENGFGPSDATCPPPRTVEVAGLTLSMPFDLLCDFATGLKPVIVGLAWLTAAFTFMGIGRRS